MAPQMLKASRVFAATALAVTSSVVCDVTYAMLINTHAFGCVPLYDHEDSCVGRVSCAFAFRGSFLLSYVCSLFATYASLGGSGQCLQLCAARLTVMFAVLLVEIVDFSRDRCPSRHFLCLHDCRCGFPGSVVASAFAVVIVAIVGLTVRGRRVSSDLVRCRLLLDDV